MPTEAAAPARSHGRMPRFEARVLGGAVLVASPALVALAICVLWGLPQGLPGWVALAAVVLLTAGLLRWQYRRIVHPLYTLSGLLEALRGGDYSLRAVADSVLGDIMLDYNLLAEQLHRQRLQYEESSFLLGKTLAALDSAVFVFDRDGLLRLANPAGQAMLAVDERNLFGRSATALGLDGLLRAPRVQLQSLRFPGRSGRFEVRHAPLRSDGHSGSLLVINDVGRVLREEERQAWQRLLRVLGHEVNNSLAPIQSMAGTLAMLAARDPLPADWRDDFRSGIEVIGKRAGALARFLSGYSRLARLPSPQCRALHVAALVDKVVRLPQPATVRVEGGGRLQVWADPDQLEQALINLLCNACEAVAGSGGEVCVRWRPQGRRVLIEVLDDGPGPPPSDNLFVPFFTTKPGGSGIGLALVRQIAEAHDGEVSLAARDGRRGAVARLWLPRAGD